MEEDFTRYDVKPEGFLNYLRYYGQHFNRKLCEFACQNMKSREYTKEKVDQLLQQHGVELKNAKLYDSVVIANWCKSVFYGSSIQDEKHFVMFIKDVFEHESDLIFNRWYADTARLGIPIEWDEMI